MALRKQAAFSSKAKGTIPAHLTQEMAEIGKKVVKLMDLYPEFQPEAYSFVFAALQFTVSRMKQPRHVTGKELLEGMREFAHQQFGPHARLVLEHWGIREPLDFGRAVFAMVEVGLMRKTDTDSLDDFKNGFDFRTAFDHRYEF